MKFDIIGDVHGRATKLKKLLEQFGYQVDLTGAYYHPERTAIFVGDIINKGGEIREAVQIVRKMVDRGAAQMIIGNHEWNWIRGKNFTYRSTTRAYSEHQDQYESDLEWVKRRPFYYQNEHFRVVHAYWDFAAIMRLNSIDGQTAAEDDELSKAADLVCNGPYYHPDTAERLFPDLQNPHRIRLRWWNMNVTLYSHLEKPLFFGHYCIEGPLAIHNQNLCCLDPCAHRTGRIAAYSWSGEKRLESDHLVII